MHTVGQAILFQPNRRGTAAFWQQEVVHLLLPATIRPVSFACPLRGTVRRSSLTTGSRDVRPCASPRTAAGPGAVRQTSSRTDPPRCPAGQHMPTRNPRPGSQLKRSADLHLQCEVVAALLEGLTEYFQRIRVKRTSPSQVRRWWRSSGLN